MKRIFALLTSFLLILGLFLSVSAAVPVGRQGVNFFNYEAADGLRWDFYNYPSYSGFLTTPDIPAGIDVSVWSESQGSPPTMPVGHYAIRIFGTGDQLANFAPNMDDSQLYSGGGTVRLAYDISDDPGFPDIQYVYVNIERISFWISGSEYQFRPEQFHSGLSRDMLQRSNVMVIEFNTTQAISSLRSIFFENVTILQQNLVTDPAIQWSPYVPSFFTSTTDEAYNAGYDTGYGVGKAEGYDLGFGQGKEEGLRLAGVADWSDILTSTIGGFMSFEVIPGFSIGGLFAMVLGIGIVMLFLKFFAGG